MNLSLTQEHLTPNKRLPRSPEQSRLSETGQLLGIQPPKPLFSHSHIDEKNSTSMRNGKDTLPLTRPDLSARSLSLTKRSRDTLVNETTSNSPSLANLPSSKRPTCNQVVSSSLIAQLVDHGANPSSSPARFADRTTLGHAGEVRNPANTNTCAPPVDSDIPIASAMRESEVDRPCKAREDRPKHFRDLIWDANEEENDDLGHTVQPGTL